jgi:hypothetical protein
MWLAGGFLVTWIESQSAYSAQHHFDEDAAVMVMLKTIGPTAGRALLMHQVWEQNRELSERWEYAQLVLGFFFFAFLLLGTRERKASLALALFMLLLVVAQRFLLTPEAATLGRSLDFAVKGGPAGDRARLGLVQNVYLAVEIINWATGGVLAVLLIFRRHRRANSRYTRQEINLVNEANHGHVDR